MIMRIVPILSDGYNMKTNRLKIIHYIIEVQALYEQ